MFEKRVYIPHSILSVCLPTPALPDHVVVKRQEGGEGEELDADIDIEGDDDVDDFGPHQYEEGDLIPCGGDDNEEKGKEEGEVGAQLGLTLPGRANADTRTPE